MDRGYSLRWEKSFEEDALRISGGDMQAFDRVFFGVDVVISRDPIGMSWAVPGRPDIRLLPTCDHFPNRPALVIAFSVIQQPPEGIISLRNVRTLEEAETAFP